VGWEAGFWTGFSPNHDYSLPEGICRAAAVGAVALRPALRSLGKQTGRGLRGLGKAARLVGVGGTTAARDEQKVKTTRKRFAGRP